MTMMAKQFHTLSKKRLMDMLGLAESDIPAPGHTVILARQETTWQRIQVQLNGFHQGQIAYIACAATGDAFEIAAGKLYGHTFTGFAVLANYDAESGKIENLRHVTDHLYGFRTRFKEDFKFMHCATSSPWRKPLYTPETALVLIGEITDQLRNGEKYEFDFDEYRRLAEATGRSLFTFNELSKRGRFSPPRIVVSETAGIVNPDIRQAFRYIEEVVIPGKESEEALNRAFNLLIGQTDSVPSPVAASMPPSAPETPTATATRHP